MTDFYHYHSQLLVIFRPNMNDLNTMWLKRTINSYSILGVLSQVIPKTVKNA